MIARKFSLSASARVGGDPRDRIRHALVLCSWSGSAPRFKRPGRAGIGRPTKRLVVRSDGTPLIQSIPHDNLVPGDLSRLERPSCRTLRTETTCSRRCILAGEHGDTRLLLRAAGLGRRGSRSS